MSVGSRYLRRQGFNEGEPLDVVRGIQGGYVFEGLCGRNTTVENSDLMV